MNDPTRDLKKLETRKRELEAKLVDAKARRDSANRDCSRFDSDLREVHKQISSLKRPEAGVIVSEHAILRYLERVEHLDFETIKHLIVGGDPKNMRLLDGRYPVNGHTILVANNTVTTAIDA